MDSAAEAYFPWVSLSKAQFTSFFFPAGLMVDRAGDAVLVGGPAVVVVGAPPKMI
jgi:hypothetical protein